MTARLLGALQANWDVIDGFAVAHDLPPLEELPLGRAANFVYWWLTKDGDAEGIDRFRAKLWQPPVGVVVEDERSPWHPASENAAFEGLRASLGVG